jgi:hypothetical protein
VIPLLLGLSEEALCVFLRVVFDWIFAGRNCTGFVLRTEKTVHNSLAIASQPKA